MLAILMPCMLLHAVVWNAIHPPMHGLPPVALTAGFGTKLPGGEAFSEWILESAYGRYVYEKQMKGSKHGEGGDGSLLAGGGTLIADAYSEVEDPVGEISAPEIAPEPLVSV